ncbi:MAG: AAA family ATPase [Candidatus Krumholzibacteriota bacterium]|nr:AAA family ATPase [Candidatus Krumholzibacteriota bacterium]
MRTVSVINQKGGCGKTTIAINLAAALGKIGSRVLLLDLDPQSHASLGLDVTYHDVQHTTYDLLRNPRIMVKDAVFTVNPSLDVIPSSPVLSAIEQELSGKPGRETRLALKLMRLNSSYDYVIIDSPPSVGLLTFNSLLASGEVLIPVEPSYFSLQGLSRLMETLELLKSETKHKTKIHVVVNNIEKRTTFSRDIVMELDRHHGDIVLDSTISHSVKYKEAALCGVSIFEMPRSERLKREFLSLARELEEKRSSLLEVDNIRDWMVKLNGPKIVDSGVVFTLKAPNARSVSLTGEFTNWSHEGIRMLRDEDNETWKIVMNLDPGDYEYRFIVDGVWIKDPNNVDTVLNEYGQENSLLIV